jgi:hypothetical protein
MMDPGGNGDDEGQPLSDERIRRELADPDPAGSIVQPTVSCG